MAVSAHFQDAVDLVDATKTLTYTVDAGYGDLEWSYSGLTVTGGSEMACSIGAAALLDAMGFRFYTPQSDFWKLPASIATDLVRSKATSWIPSLNIFLVYGHSWAGTNAASRDLLNDAYAKWATLVGANNSSYPAGHRWNNVIVNSTAFFDANPDLIKVHTADPLTYTFDLEGIEGTARWDVLAEYCAAFLLDAGLNEFNRTNFDPVDGNTQTSDLVYPFTNLVVSYMRAGTSAIGSFSAQAGVPDAAIGLYAYAAHRLPPSESYSPGVYTQVALAFNSTGLSYQDLIDQHGALADAIAIREYFDTQVWSKGRPLVNARNKTGYFERFNDYRASGAVEVNSEFTANWLVNAVMARVAIEKLRDGVEDWAGVIAAITADVFDDDPAVAALLTYWVRPSETYHKWSLARSFDHINDMADGWYKAHFKRWASIYYQFYRIENAADYGITRDPGQPGDTLEAEISKLLAWVTAVRDDDIIHSYAFIRQEANSALDDYPDLKFNASPEPDWFASPYLPTDADFTSAYAAIQAETVRDDALDGDDLVLMAVTPTATRPNMSPATRYQSDEGVANYIIVGPSVVSVTDQATGEMSTASYGRGVFAVNMPQDHIIEWEGGAVFMDTFPFVRKDPDGTALNHWLYVPTKAAGEVDLTSEVRWSFYDEEPARKDVKPGVSFPTLGPGQVAVDNVNTRGTVTNGNCNRYLSPDPNFALVPAALARQEGKTSRIKIISGS